MVGTAHVGVFVVDRPGEQWVSVNRHRFGPSVRLFTRSGANQVPARVVTIDKSSCHSGCMGSRTQCMRMKFVRNKEDEIAARYF
jgi:hypothetical protein